MDQILALTDDDSIEHIRLTDMEIINIKQNIQGCFEETCISDNIFAIRWVYNLAKYHKLTLKVDRIFAWCCINNKIGSVRLLVELSETHEKFNDVYDIDTCINLSEIFRLVCSKGHTAMAKLLYELSENEDKNRNLDKIDIDSRLYLFAQNDYSFRMCCKFKHLELIEWLCSLTNEYSFDKDSISGDIIPRITNLQSKLKTITKEKDNDRLEALYNDAESIKINDDDICPVCMSTDSSKWIKLIKCNHILCVNCYVNIKDNKCVYRCKGSHMRNIKLIRSSLNN